MQPDFSTLKPVASSEPDFSTLTPIKRAPNINTYGAIFRASADDNPLEAGLKAAGNIPTSAFGLAKGLASAITNPVQTVRGIGDSLGGGIRKGIKAATGIDLPSNEATDQMEVVASQLGSFLKDRYGSLENLQKTATEDPFGFGTDIVGLITGGATLAGKGAQVASTLSKTARLATSPVTKTAGKATELAGTTAKFGASQVTGLNPESLTQLLKNPGAFKNPDSISRLETATKVAEALDSRLEELGDLGKNYEVIRNTPTTVLIPENTVKKVLDKYGVKLDGGGKIVTSPESRPLSQTDRVALQDFISNYGQETVLSSNSFLNTREALSNLSRFEQGKTSLPQQIARDLRSEYDTIGKNQIKGLKELDTQYAPERQLLSQLKKDIFDAKGDLKDGAINKIANLTGKGKDQVLERVKQVVPDIEQRVKVLKAVEDIERASGLKVGTYVRAGTAVGGIATGNIPMIIASILAQPEIAVPLLRGAGYVGEKATPVLQALRAAAENVNGFRFPAPLLAPASSLGEIPE